ncbi:EAL and HDOD domain-containing protein [Parahaliea mediterranea]|uniref:EAL and HDOD domain-containing protein n=1 Tax=Parahaliea mediterranea TaxID=651086 RepID=UPI0014737683|nr:HDOD domain-containing protein [Parahaliea mediterranea]
MLNAPLLGEENPLDALLACQPVLSRNQDVVAFDLLLDHATPGATLNVQDIQTAVPLVLESYARIFQHGRFLSVPSFVKLSPAMLFDEQLPALPRKQLILEVVADRQPITPALVRRLGQLAAEGHHLALGGYQPDRPDLGDLLATVHVVRIDTATLAGDALAHTVDALRQRGVDLLADGVADAAQFRHCVDLGFNWFQGSFLSAPTPVKGKKISGNKLLLLEMLAKLQDPDATAASLEALAIRDANLTFRILRIVNSAAQGIRREVDTLSQAITILGTEEIKRWVNLFLVESEPGKPEALTRNMLVRARMCEILAELDSQPMPVHHFIVGLLSQLDVLMDIEMSELLQQLPLRQETKQALLSREGPLGDTLADVEHYERGRFELLSQRFDPAFYEVAYRHACAWARQTQAELGDPA